MTCPACGQPATQGWQRRPTPEEIQQYGLDPEDPDNTIQVMACDADALPPEMTTVVHQANCQAPVGECDCPRAEPQ